MSRLWRVGDPIMASTDLDDLPVGATIVAATDADDWHTKISDDDDGGRWCRFDTGDYDLDADDFSMDGFNVVRSLPLGYSNRLRVGDVATTEAEVAALPVGTGLGHTAAAEDGYVRVEGDDTRVWGPAAGGGTRRYHHADLVGYTVLEFPAGYTPYGPVEPVTLDRVKAEFWRAIWARTAYAGVNESITQAALDELGVASRYDPVPEMRFDPRTQSRLCDSGLSHVAMPDGTLCYVGDPDDPDHFGVFRWQRSGGWLPILGRLVRLRGSSARVLSVPEGSTSPEATEWARTGPVDGEADRVRAWKAHAWKVGMRVKRENRWCPELEASLAAGGVTVRDALAGMPQVAPEQVSLLPVGALLGYQSADGVQWAWYLRTRDATNRARTRRVAGEGEHLGHFKDRMSVVWDGTGEMTVPLTRHAHLSSLPRGSQFRQVTDPSNLWTRVSDDDHGWQSNRTNSLYAAEQFDIDHAGNWELVRIGGADD